MAYEKDNIKQISEQWISDPLLSACSLSTQGFWANAIFRMILLGASGQETHSINEWARLCRATPDEVIAAIADLKAHGAADVHEHDVKREMSQRCHADVTPDVTQMSQRCHADVTLICRPMRRDFLNRKSSRDRKQRQRNRGDGEGGTQNVPPHVTQASRLRPLSSLNPKKEKKKKDPRHAVVTVDFPAGLDTPPFRDAWAMFERHRKAIRRPLTQDAARLNLSKCGQWGEVRAIAAIELSVSRGWTGIFEESGKPGAPPASKPGEDDGEWKPRSLKPGELASMMQDGGGDE